jgi:signal transduction histidine kinase
MVVSIITLVLFSTQRSYLNQQRKLAEDAIYSTFQMSQLVAEFHNAQLSRIGYQWITETENLNRTISMIEPRMSSISVQKRLALDSAEHMQVIFGRITDTMGSNRTNNRLENDLYNNILIEQQALIGSIRSIRDSISGEQKRFSLMLDIVVIVLFVGCCGFMGTTSFMGMRRIYSHIQKMLIGMEQLAMGNLDTRIESESSDELGTLITDLNYTISRLRVVTASRDELDREIQVRKHAETELQYKNNELEQIVYATSHDLRSPLVNIEGFSRELTSDLKVLVNKVSDITCDNQAGNEIHEICSDLRDSLGFINKSVEKMERLLAGLLKLSRIGRQDVRCGVVDTNRLVDDVRDTYEYQFREYNGTLIRTDLLPCMADDSLLNQVFSNLIGNAIKYRSRDRDLVVSISCVETKDSIIYSVSDNGIGIHPGHLDKIFNLFHRLNPGETPGEGLGLAIVKRIIERNNGWIWVESNPGAGSEFFIKLPKVKKGVKIHA